jgi:hypothetical protein
MANEDQGRPEPGPDDLEALIVWLSHPYLNDPIWTGSPDEDRLRRTWDAVIGSRGPEGVGRWFQCPACGGWQVLSPIEQEAVNG